MSVDGSKMMQYIYQKKFIDSLNSELHRKEVLANKTREELNKCHDRITELEQERDKLYKRIEICDENDDM